MKYYLQKNQQRKVYEFFISMGILLMATGASLAFEFLGVKELNIILIYIVSILLITIETNGYFWGITSCVLSMVLFNFFFTQPKYTLRVNDPNYFISFLLFLIVAFIVSTLVSRLQRHAMDSFYNEKQSHLLYEISVGYLNIYGLSNILNYGITSLNKLELCPAIVYSAKSSTELSRPYYPEDMNFYNDLPENDTIALWCLTNVATCGFGTAYFNQSNWKYIPMKREEKVFGVVAFLCKGEDINHHGMLFVNTIISQMTLALQREELTTQKENIRMEMEKEQLQGNILRSLSHDLRTPLTGIAGSSSFMIESYDKLDRESMIPLLTGINTDANWLMRLAENLLSTIRIQDGKLQLNRKEEVVDDIVYEACSHMEKFLLGHPLEVHIPEEVVTLSVDSHLIVQVLVNLLDNAVKHTAPEASIEVSVFKENNYLAFEVADNGGGIEPAILDSVFHGFIVGASETPDSHRGMGLGLSICKSIIDAHSGSIMAFNNNNGGATFKVMLPIVHT